MEYINSPEFSDRNAFCYLVGGSLLLLCGIFAYLLSTRDHDSKYAWYIFSIIFTFFSFDELGSIHERVGNLDFGLHLYVITGLILGFGVLFSLKTLLKNKQDKRGVLLLLIGLALIVSAAPNEYLEHRINWPYSLIGPRLAFEEGLELIGTFICLLGITRYISITKIKGIEEKRIARSDDISKIIKVIAIGFVFNFVVAWITTNYIVIGPRGNPATWFFMAVFFLLAIYYFLKAVNDRLLVHLLAGGYFMSLSGASIYFLHPLNTSVLHNYWLLANPIVVLACQLGFLTIFYLLLKGKLNWRDTAKFASVVIALGLSWYIKDQFFHYVTFSFFSLMVAIQLLPKAEFSFSLMKNIKYQSKPAHLSN